MVAPRVTARGCVRCPVFSEQCTFNRQGAPMSRSTILLMRGAVGVAFGLLALAWPGLTILALIGIFAGYALLDGIITLWLGLTSTPTAQRPWAPALRGILGIVAGIFTFLWPKIGRAHV